MSGEILIGLMTVPDRTTADRIVDQLVQEQLIACGNISTDVASIYRWQGAVERASEILVIMKTTVAQAAQVIRRVIPRTTNTAAIRALPARLRASVRERRVIRTAFPSACTSSARERRSTRFGRYLIIVSR